jgi:hypothetical protein
MLGSVADGCAWDGAVKTISRWIAATAVCAGMASVGVGVAAGTAQAEGPSYQGDNCPVGQTCTHWCPGDPLIPGHQVISWDWSVCHDWYWNSYGVVDVTTNWIYPWAGVPRELP